MTPVSGFSILIRKPWSCQKLLTTGQTFSGGSGITSQRSLAVRSILILSKSGRTPAVPGFGPALRSASYVERVADPGD
jgi:hypothetical protein